MIFFLSQKIDFPAVTVCNHNRIKCNRLKVISSEDSICDVNFHFRVLWQQIALEMFPTMTANLQVYWKSVAALKQESDTLLASFF